MCVEVRCRLVFVCAYPAPNPAATPASASASAAAAAAAAAASAAAAAAAATAATAAAAAFEGAGSADFAQQHGPDGCKQEDLQFLQQPGRIGLFA